MSFKLFRKGPSADAVYGVYSAIVAQSRRPRFYAEWGVPDTVTGRFDMITLHLALLFGRLKGESGTTDFAQAVFDLFFRDMDRSLREMGAGDLAVPKKIQKMGNLFYGLMTSVNEALDRNDRTGLEAALRRNVFGDALSAGVAPLAEYLASERQRLATVPVAEIVAGRFSEAA